MVLNEDNLSEKYWNSSIYETKMSMWLKTIAQDNHFISCESRKNNIRLTSKKKLKKGLSWIISIEMVSNGYICAVHTALLWSDFNKICTLNKQIHVWRIHQKSDKHVEEIKIQPTNKQTNTKNTFPKWSSQMW